MISKSELLKLVVGLAEVNDTDLLNNNSILTAEICDQSARESVRRIGELVRVLHAQFDFLASAEFRALGAGKSDAYRAMLAKQWSNPEKSAQLSKAYGDALCSLLTDDRAYGLTSKKDHEILDRLRGELELLTNR